VEREAKRATKKLLSPPLKTSFFNPEKISELEKKGKPEPIGLPEKPNTLPA